MRLSRVCLISCAILALSACKTNVTLIQGNKILEGDQTVKADETLRLTKGASLTVKGNMTVDGTIDCSAGAVTLTVEKNLTVKKGIACMGRTDAAGKPMDGITMVVKGAVTIDDSATIESDGHIQIVDNESKVLGAEALDALFSEIEQDTGKGGPRIGPLTTNEPQPQPSAAAEGTGRPSDHWLLSALSGQANAQPAMDPCVDQNGNPVPDCVRIGGTWVVGHGQDPPSSVDVKTPEKGVKKIVLNFNFGPGKQVQFQNFSLKGPGGRDGKAGPESCNVTGEKGEDAFRFRVNAGKIKINSFTLTLGSGGKGGDATTSKDCYPVGKAKAGDGGKAGNFKMEADESFDILGTFTINPGVGGAGGTAKAFAKNGVDGCGGEKGGDAIATGGAGGENKKELTIFGSVSGTENIELGDIEGGQGGDATAEPGKGGNGTGCGCPGGPGGKGTATAGKGGNASVSAGPITSNAVGGDGGDADSKGGRGGDGGMCNPFGPGGNGGKGGDAVGKEGKGGSARSPGIDGTKNEKGGDGGNGGDGCNEGGGGAGGSPNGAPGAPGRNLCLPPPPSSAPWTDPGGRGSSASSAGAVTTGGQTSSMNSSTSSAKASSSSSKQTSSGPHVISLNPANGATDVETDVRIQIVFSEPMSRASLEGAIHSNFRFEVDKTTDTSIELRPQGLLNDKSYEFSVGSLAVSASGKALLESKTVRFKTKKAASGGTTGGGATGTTPPPTATSSSTQSTTQPSSSSSQQQEMIQVLIIQSKKVPVSQTVVENHDECPNHYHAKNGSSVTALDGSQLPEPGGCTGYGRVEQVPKQQCTPDGATCQ